MNSSDEELQEQVNSIDAIEGMSIFMTATRQQELDQLLQRMGKSEIYISTEQLPVVLSSIGMDITSEPLDVFVTKCCKIPGRISQDEIQELIRLKTDEDERFLSILQACNKLDKLRTGQIKCGKLLALIRATRKKQNLDDPDLDKKTVERLIQEGEINYANGVAAMRRVIRNF
jgi:hypothetical protein